MGFVFYTQPHFLPETSLHTILLKSLPTAGDDKGMSSVIALTHPNPPHTLEDNSQPSEWLCSNTG